MPALTRLSLCMALGGMIAGGQAVAQSSYSVYFPAYGEDLPYGHFWRYSHNHTGDGANANDFHGARFNETTRAWVFDPTPSTQAVEDTIIGTIPVRAAADGEVIACWREYPDSPPGDYEADTSKELDGGNNLVIRTNDGKIVFYAHMLQNSIPTSLCPVSGNSDGYPFSIANKTGSFPTEYLVPEAQRAEVHVGQFLGRVGHTGTSSRPHLHFHVQNISEDSNGVFTLGSTIPHRFFGASRAHNVTDGDISEDWTAVNGHIFTEIIDSGAFLIMPGEGRKSGLSTREPGRLDVVTRSKDRQLQFKFWDGSSWSGWTKLGGVLTSNAACASWSSDRIDCFARGVDLQLVHKYWTKLGGWSDWNDHGGTLTSAPSVVARAGERLDVFVRGKNLGLWQKSWNGSSWSQWRSLGGKLSSAPACVSWSGNRLDCVARGRNNHLWHIHHSGGSWSGWVDHGGVLTSAPAISSRGQNRLDVFARGQNNHLWIKQWNGGWSEWQDLGGVLASGPSAVSWSSGRIDVQAVGQNGHLWHRYWSNAGGWSNWSDLGSFFE